ncbi:hypothetical protein BHM03_00016381 [Ensete ventricosum]|nr:hypothetical protein BHM03_00016381 [Ensete ventricosum]
MVVISFARIQEERQCSKDENHTSTSSVQPSSTIHFQPSLAAEKIDKRRTSRQIDKGPMLALRRKWSHDHRYMRGRLLLIEPINDSKHEEEDHEHEEVTKEDPQSTDCMVHALVGYMNLHTMEVAGLLKQQPIAVLINTESTNNFMNSKVVARMALHIEDYNRFDIKVADGRILKCDQKCPSVKLMLQDQEIIADFFLLSLDDYRAVLDIEWLTTLGDVS